MERIFSKIRLILISRNPRWTGPVAVIFLVLCIGFGILIFKSKMSLKKKIMSAILFFYSYNLLVITLLMRPVQENRVFNPLPFFINEYAKQNRGGWDWIFNVILFLPLGLLVVYLINHKYRILYTMLIGFGITLTIEITQYFSKLGSFELDDLIANTLGAGAGVLIYFISRKYYIQRKAKRLSSD